MKKTNAFIAAALAASMLTACGGTDTAEVTSAESTVSETTAATVPETDTLSAESEETTTKTSVEPVESVSDTEAVEEAENTHWDNIVYDTTLKTDVTDWELNAENYVRTGMVCTLVEALQFSDMPDVVKAYLYENSSTYKMCFDKDTEIQGIVGGVGDFDSDGVEEAFYAVNYVLYDDGWTPSIGRLGAFPSDIVIYDAAEETVYLCDNSEVTYVGCYFESDPAAEWESLDTRWYEWCYVCEGENMYFTEDNIFISCNLGAMEYYDFAGADNCYNKLVYENGKYTIQSIGTAGWCLSVPLSEVEYVEADELYRRAYTDGDIPCVLIQ